MGVIGWPGNLEVVEWYVVGAGMTLWRMQVAMHVDGDYCYVCLAQGGRPGESAKWRTKRLRGRYQVTVSYTHLTLPTICSV